MTTDDAVLIRLATLEERVVLEARLRALMDQDIAMISDRLRVNSTLIQAVHLTQAKHGEKLARVEATQAEHTAVLNRIVAVLNQQSEILNEQGDMLRQLIGQQN